MKILTWNINGIRASKVPLKELFDSLDADIICIQETKVTRDQLDERTAILDGYSSYYSFSRGRSGYSGVATYVRDPGKPWAAEEGLSGCLAVSNETDNVGCYGDQSDFCDEELRSLDKEGRAVITKHKLRSDSGEDRWLTVINVYCPRADVEERVTFKLRFYELLQTRAEALLRDGSHVIVLGDVNTSHRQMDHCDPYEEFEKNPGRAWLTKFLWDPDVPEVDSSASGGKFVDTFRRFHPEERNAFTCWSSATGARATNYGTRIDYIFADLKLSQEAFDACVILPDVQGSDHCPVKATLNWELVPCKKCPSLCTKYMPEFTGKQQKLLSYFKKVSSQPDAMSHDEAKDSEPGKDVVGTQDDLAGTKRKCLEPEEGGAGVKKVKKQSSGPKQANLMAFFGKKSSNSNELKKSESKTQNGSKPEPEKPAEAKTEQNTKDSSAPKNQGDASQKWKMLLKGPAPPPLCRGHKEPCVLRTVIKESLNKGRQFYVCNRPDGHKTNPAARCDHFEWVDKKKK